ncbi:class I SAM-dependent methyltransferase [Nocardia otitidiscaviarum]|uniref:class I SAM-dependent methyltransferase n=1 Tax=Nocardia otitidiscaviarum TaxID=1823 RepID=UPI0018948BBE|nr:class I SAM-dependent methyltransferase [Nocardia otitidiscaviarum]MBF6181617.1 methyltransferase domain-containing protein [Nocardia otitidiscaviarum]
MTKNNPASDTDIVRAMGNRQDYLPAAGRNGLLPFYDLLTRALGVPAVHRTLIARAGLRPGAQVVEIGCGTGNLTVLAKDTHPGIEITGTDPDPLALARAERKAKGRSGIDFQHAYAQDLPFPDASVDHMLSAFMLHHLPTDVKSDAAAEALRILRPGGQLHIVDVGGRMTTADGFMARRMLKGGHVTDNLGDGIPRLLRTAGFDAEEIGSTVTRRLGRVTYYRATRPA